MIRKISTRIFKLQNVFLKCRAKGTDKAPQIEKRRCDTKPVFLGDSLLINWNAKGFRLHVLSSFSNVRFLNCFGCSVYFCLC
jgi:hypothetical protein